ncbi:hypothetical protein [Methylobacter sp.]|uniref:hypothetical protein n=1 Tax=Methylobacter sp. TaxID=2051955 RepID=UPI003DA3321F
MARLLDRTVNQDGVIEEAHYDYSTGILHLRNAVDLSGLMEHNLQLRNSENNGFTRDRGLRHIAELDMVTVEKLLTEHGIDVFNPEHMPRLKMWLRDRDNRGFVTCSGKF